MFWHLREGCCSVGFLHPPPITTCQTGLLYVNWTFPQTNERISKVWEIKQRSDCFWLNTMSVVECVFYFLPIVCVWPNTRTVRLEAVYITGARSSSSALVQNGEVGQLRPPQSTRWNNKSVYVCVYAWECDYESWQRGQGCGFLLRPYQRPLTGNNMWLDEPAKETSGLLATAEGLQLSCPRAPRTTTTKTRYCLLCQSMNCQMI